MLRVPEEILARITTATKQECPLPRHLLQYSHQVTVHGIRQQKTSLLGLIIHLETVHKMLHLSPLGEETLGVLPKLGRRKKIFQGKCQI